MRKNVISWDNYFLSVAKLSGMRSKDPSTQVGACIVNEKKKIVGVGYNGMPYGCDDSEFPWGREGDFEETKYPYVVHAELNAILNSTTNLENCKIYVSLFPCNECAKAIVQSGIKEVIYDNDKYNGTSADNVSKRILTTAGVRLRKISPIEVLVKGVEN